MCKHSLLKPQQPQHISYRPPDINLMLFLANLFLRLKFPYHLTALATW